MLPMCPPQPAAQAAEQNDNPEDKPYGEKNLPEAAEVEILESLVAEPGPASLNPAVDAGELSGQTAENDDRQGAQQAIGEPLLTAWLAAGSSSGQKNSGGKKEVETQKIASCKCQVRAMLNGRMRARSMPKKFVMSAR